MTLPFDVSRCTGFDPDVEWCPERDTCQWYLAWRIWDAEAGIQNYEYLPLSMAVRDCRDKIEVSEE